LCHAQHYLAAGLSLLPIRPGSKEPDGRLLPRVYDAEHQQTRPSWKMYQERLPTPDELESWFAQPDVGIGIVGGAVSGGLLILDLESTAAYEQWQEHIAVLLPADLVAQLPVVATGKGWHLYLRCAEPGGNRKLATRERQVIAETRGEGGYVLAPPSVHPSGAVYHVAHGDLTCIPHLDAAQVCAVMDAARALAPAPPHPTGSTNQQPGESVIAAFNQAHTIEQVLEAHGYRLEKPGRYIRPGGERSSIIVRDGRSVHFNTNDPLYAEAPGGGNYRQTPFSAWCQLAHQGDVRAAVKAAATELGMRREPAATNQHLLEQAGRCLGIGQPAADAAQDPDEEPDTWPYFIHEGGIWMEQHASDGSPRVPLLLTNFTARIVAETDLNDGDTTDEQYTILAQCGTRTRRIEMRRCEFEGDTALSRIVAALGARARVNPKAQARYVIDAIKACSHHITAHTLYTHTGWVEGCYLFENGVVTAEGWQEATSTTASRAHLPRRLTRYRLNPHPDGSLTEALAVLEDMLELAPSSVVVPVLAGVLLAPVLESLAIPAPMIHVYGPTGSHKTSLCCALMSLMGEFVPAYPTDTWTSTANSVQRLGWHLKDAPMLLDDYKAANVKANQVTFLLQNYGDGMARGRLDANSEARNAYPVRAVLISSGEDQPEGESSTLARILSVDLPRGVVQRSRLTNVQRDAPHIHHLTIAYLRWLAATPQTDIHERHRQTRASILTRLEQTEHATNAGRVASNVAALYIAWQTFGRFLEDQGHWSPERVAAWLRQCKRELVHLAQRQIDLTTTERYSQVFLETVRELIASGKAVLVDAERDGPILSPGQVLIGARDTQGVYLIAGTAYDEVCKQTRATGRTVGYTKRALGQLLDQDGLLRTTNPPSLTIQRRINGARLWCWHLPPTVLE
jgi:hypothetical protein